MTRRELLAAGGVAPAHTAHSMAPKRASINPRISAITDEIGLSTGRIHRVRAPLRHAVSSKSAIRRASQKEYFTAPRSRNQGRRRCASRKEGLKVSFVNTSLLKFAWPGMEPARQPAPKRRTRARSAWPPRNSAGTSRMDDLQKAIRCAQIMGCDKVRVFTGIARGRSRSHVPAHRRHHRRNGEGRRAGKSLSADRERRLAECRHFGGAGRHHEADSLQVGGLSTGTRTTPTARRTSYPGRLRLLPKERMLNLQVKGKGVMPAEPRERGLEGHHAGARPATATKAKSAWKRTSSTAP